MTAESVLTKLFFTPKSQSSSQTLYLCVTSEIDRVRLSKFDFRMVAFNFCSISTYFHEFKNFYI